MKGWAASRRGIRWTLGGIAAGVLAPAAARVLLVPARGWFAHHDVGSAEDPVLRAARDAARGRLLTAGAGLLATGALVFTARTFVLSRDGQLASRRPGSGGLDMTLWPADSGRHRRRDGTGKIATRQNGLKVSSEEIRQTRLRSS